MNYFNKAEKTLKSCLKERLSITTATVVGFLIAGTVVFGETAVGKLQDKLEISNKQNSETIDVKDYKRVLIKGDNKEGITLTITGKIGDADNQTSIDRGLQVGGAKNGAVINKAEIYAQRGVEISYGKRGEKLLKEFTNEGKINANLVGIYSNDDYQGYAEKIVNKGEVRTDNNGTGNSRFGVFVAGDTQFENEGIIDAKVGADKNIVGVRVSDGATGVNNGSITVARLPEESTKESDTRIIGVEVAERTKRGGGKTTSFINNGTIDVTGKGAVGILYGQWTPSSNDNPEYKEGGTLTAKNSENGKIKVTGANAIGVKMGKFTNNGKKAPNKEFTNDGLIELGEGTTNGIGIFVEEGKAINNGTIALEIGDKEKAETNNIAIKVGENGKAINTGIIKITDKTVEELKDFNTDKLYDVNGKGMIVSKGSIVDKNNNRIAQESDLNLSGDITVDDINSIAGESGAVVINGDSTLTKGSAPIKIDDLNIAGSSLTIKNNNGGVVINGTTINITKANDKNGVIKIGGNGAKADLTIVNGTVNTALDKDTIAITFDGNAASSLTLSGSKVIGNIGDNNSKGNITIENSSEVNGTIKVQTIKIGGTSDKNILNEVKERNNRLTLSSESKIDGGSIIIDNNGQLVLGVGQKGETALSQEGAQKVTIVGTVTGKTSGNGITVTDDANGDILLSTGNLTGTGISVDLGKENIFANTSVSMENGNNGVYTAEEGADNTIKLDYNKKLFKENGAINAINNGAMNANNLFENTDLAVREQQMKNIYEGSIYSETVRASYDSAKTFENVLRGMNTVSETGKWTAFGSGVYNKNSYDRAGHDSEIETTGLLAGVEYGLDANTSVGFAFAGANQDVDSLTGSADGTALYLGTYAKKVVGNYKFMAGLGYQYGDYDADNVTGYAQSSDSYNSNTLSAFVEGRYSMSLGNGIAFEPKLKLGYTYVDQDDTRDANFGVSDASLSTFDTELGADLIKTYALKDGKTNLVLGVSYVRAMGDTDKEFTGDFTKSNGGFAIKGAQLSENTGKFDLSLEVSKDSGFFYNGGVNLQVGSDDYRNYGVNFGAGYKF